MGLGIPVFKLAGTSAASTTLNTVSWPTHAANDVALLIVQTEAEASALVTNAGFAPVTNSPQSTGTAAATNAVALQVYWKRATGSAEAAVTLMDAGDHTFAQIITFSNVARSGDPWDVTSGNVKAAATTNCQVTGATTTTANCLIVAVVAGSVDTATAQASAWTNANLANPAMAELSGCDVATTTGGGGSLSVGAGGLATPGATGTTTVTLASASKNAFMMIALREDAYTGTGSLAVATPAVAGSPPSFNDIRQSIIDGLDSAQSEGTGWDVKKAGIAVTDVVRSSDTVVTITLPALATYDITAQETITATVPNLALMSGAPLVASPSFTVDTAGGPVTGTGSMALATPSVAGSALRGLLGTAALAVALTMAGTGQQTESGSGSVAVASPSYAGTVVQTGSGSGTLAVATPSVSASGLVGNVGSGSLVLPFSLSGTGSSTSAGLSGSGAVAVPALGLAGSGFQTESGSGALAVAQAMAGTGFQTQSGSGSLAAAGPAFSGTVIQTESGTGSLAVAKTVSGSGVAGNPITGTGSIAAPKPVLAGASPFAAARAAIIAGLDSAQAEGSGWDAIVKAGIPVQNVVRTSGSVVTITLPAFASYNITATETITATVPSSALASGGPVVASPSFTVSTNDVTGTGSLAVAKPAHSGAGIAGTIGSGSLRITPPVYAFGDTIALAKPSMSGAGSVSGSYTASGSLAVAQPIYSGTAIRGYLADGSLAAALAFSGSGTAGASTTGTGSMAVQLAPSGTGQQTETGSGALAVAQTLQGSGFQTSTATGSLAVAATMAGGGQQTESGSGGLSISIQMSGSGGSGTFVQGSGALAVAAPAFDGTGTEAQIVSGSGTVAIATPAEDGAGAAIYSGSGAIGLATPAVAVDGLAGAIGSGGLAVQGPSVSGTGIRGNSGTGSLTLSVAMDGRATNVSAATTGKYRTEHNSALVDVGAATGFESEHASALKDVGDAGE